VFRGLVDDISRRSSSNPLAPAASARAFAARTRFLTEKDRIRHGGRAGRDLAAQQISRPLLELSAVRALRILEDHQAAPGVLAADDHTPFRSVPGRHSSCFHDAQSASCLRRTPLMGTRIPPDGLRARRRATAVVGETPARNDREHGVAIAHPLAPRRARGILSRWTAS